MARNALFVVAVILVAVFTSFYLKSREAVVLTPSRVLGAHPGLVAIPDSKSGVTGSSVPAVGGDNTIAPSRTAGSSSRTKSARGLPSVEGFVTNSQALRRDLQREIQALQQTLATRQQSLQAKAQVLQEVRPSSSDANTVGDSERAPASAADIESRTDELEALTSDLEEMRTSREAIRRQEDDAIRIQENRTELAMSQIDANIKPLEETVAQTRHQLELWNRDHAGINQEGPHNVDLENALNQQQQQLEDLREQRLQLTTGHHAQADSIYNLSQQARDDLRSEEQNVRGQIFSLQSEIRRIQRAQTQERMSRQSQSSRLQQAQRDLQTEAAQVKSIETSLQSKQAELRKLE